MIMGGLASEVFNKMVILGYLVVKSGKKSLFLENNSQLNVKPTRRIPL